MKYCIVKKFSWFNIYWKIGCLKLYNDIFVFGRALLNASFRPDTRETVAVGMRRWACSMPGRDQKCAHRNPGKSGREWGS